MRGSSSVSRRAASPGNLFSIDVVILVPRLRQLGVLVHDDGLLWGTGKSGETLEAAARRIARLATGTEPIWLEQFGALGDGTGHPGGVVLSIGFVSVLPEGALEETSPDVSWTDVRSIAGLPERQRLLVKSGLEAVRTRMDHAPVAFRLLPPSFTLTDLQQVYELLLSRRLHKASFRRALQASWLVEPTSEWRSEGRGRPAQLYRFAPRRRRPNRRTVRFDLL